MSKIKSLCVGCGFATYDGELLDQGKSVQVGCAVNRIKHFEEAGVEIEVMPDNTFRVHRYCNMARHPLWVDKYGPESIDIAKEEARVKVDIIIPVFSGTSIRGIVHTINSIGLVDHVHHVYIENHGGPERGKIMLKHCQEKLSCKYSIRNYTFNSSTSHLVHAVNLAVSKSDGQYYTVLIPGEELPNDTISLLEYAVNIKLEQIIMVEGTDERPFLVYRLGHIKVGGATDDQTVYELLREKAKEDNQLHVIKTWDELCSYRK